MNITRFDMIIIYFIVWNFGLQLVAVYFDDTTKHYSEFSGWFVLFVTVCAFIGFGYYLIHGVINLFKRN